MEKLNAVLEAISGFLWGWPMIILLLGTHLFLTLRLRFPQRHIFKAIKLSVSKDKGADGEVSQFGALATSLAATIGTCLLYTSPSPRDRQKSRMPSSA